jgi:peptidoglycan/xylan/chitin deacetylase (PgdA/CDA1 family)
VTASLQVVMYHYIRDLPNTSFPKINGMLTRDFREQLAALQSRYEMGTLESALDFMRGAYRPRRDLCLLTFDDGLKEHYAEITPILIDRGVQGLFFVITSCLDGAYVAPVHLNHFLMAAMDFEEYRNAFLERLNDLTATSPLSTTVDAAAAQRVYRWDNPAAASFKYLLNFVLDGSLLDRVLRHLFEEEIGDAESFGRKLYLSSREAKQMQAEGMIIGGHSHQHKPLSSLSEAELQSDLNACRESLTIKLLPQDFWPFCYPYGKRNSFDGGVMRQVQQLGFSCSFSSEFGSNRPGDDLFTIRRLDCKDVPTQQVPSFRNYYH